MTSLRDPNIYQGVCSKSHTSYHPNANVFPVPSADISLDLSQMCRQQRPRSRQVGKGFVYLTHFFSFWEVDPKVFSPKRVKERLLRQSLFYLEEKGVSIGQLLIPICPGRRHGHKTLLTHLVFYIYFCPNPGATDFIHPTDRKRRLPRDGVIGSQDSEREAGAGYKQETSDCIFPC